MFLNEDGISNTLQPYQQSDKLIILKELLIKRVLVLAKQLSNREQNILELRLEGKTQTEIAKSLKLTQKIVFAALRQITDKLKIISSTDPECISILDEIEETKELKK